MSAATAASAPLELAVLGAGAAGCFAALAAAEAAPGLRITLFEAGAQPLAKVRISGGGRCNVTHACFDPHELVKYYPRGGRELLGPFHRFGPRDTIAWFAARGVTLKTEADGRMFPTTDDSRTIIDALLTAAAERGLTLRLRCGVRQIRPAAPGYALELTDGTTVRADRVIVAPGGLRGTGAVSLVESLGHTVEPPVPSLFTFHLDDPRLRGLEGLSVPQAAASVPEFRLQATGPVLVTHWGLSGPAILRLSAWGARPLAAAGYRFALRIAWVAERGAERLRADLVAHRSAQARRLVTNGNPWELPVRLWERLVAAAGIPADRPWTSVSNPGLAALAQQVGASEFVVTGKSLNKEEFVTCGGVRLREVDLRTLESRIQPGLYFAGEALDIDGVTGGFNFQAAWTTGWLAGHAAAHPRP